MPVLDFGFRLIPGELIDQLLTGNSVLGAGAGYSTSVSAGNVLSWPYQIGRVSVSNTTDIQKLAPTGGALPEGQQVRLWWPNGGSFFGSPIQAGGNITLEVYNGALLITAHS